MQSQLGDYEIAWVDAEVGKTDSGMLSLLPCSNAAPLHKSVLVGDLKMADFKQFLASKGVQVHFLHLGFIYYIVFPLLVFDTCDKCELLDNQELTVVCPCLVLQYRNMKMNLSYVLEPMFRKILGQYRMCLIEERS